MSADDDGLLLLMRIMIHLSHDDSKSIELVGVAIVTIAISMITATVLAAIQLFNIGLASTEYESLLVIFCCTQQVIMRP